MSENIERIATGTLTGALGFGLSNAFSKNMNFEAIFFADDYHKAQSVIDAASQKYRSHFTSSASGTMSPEIKAGLDAAQNTKESAQTFIKSAKNTLLKAISNKVLCVALITGISTLLGATVIYDKIFNKK